LDAQTLGLPSEKEERPEPVLATLDVEDDVPEEGPVCDPMSLYLRAIQKRLVAETSAKQSGLHSSWLVAMLKKITDGWWLRARSAKKICQLLGIQFQEPAYYKAVLVWLPDLEFGVEAMPPCPECVESERVGAHAFRTDGHIARRICDMDDHFFIMSRRYICHSCADTRRIETAAKDAELLEAERRLEAAGCRVGEISALGESISVPKVGPSYTFKRYDSSSRARQPYGYGNQFPAFLTHRGGVSTIIVDAMRPLKGRIASSTEGCAPSRSR